MTHNQHKPGEALSERIHRITLPGFKELADLSVRHQAIDLGGGKPDFPADKTFKDAAIQAIQDDFNQYAPAQGILELRAGISQRLHQKTQIRYDAEQEITICNGVTESLAASLLAVINPGDEVIILTPAFPAYTGNVCLAGGIPVYVELTTPHFYLDKERLEAAITPRTKAIVFNSPHNPSGRIFTHEEIRGVAELSQKYDFLVITDEIYDEIYFTKEAPPAIWQLPGMRLRTIITNGFSKTYSVTGWRLGYVLAPPELTRGIRTAHSFLVLSSALPLQLGMVEAIRSREEYYLELRKSYAARLAVLTAGLAGLEIPCLAPEGGYFLLADFSDLGWDDDLAFAKYLTAHIGVSARPLSAFYPNGHSAGKELWLRFAFCKQEEVLTAAIERLKKLSLTISLQK